MIIPRKRFEKGLQKTSFMKQGPKNKKMWYVVLMLYSLRLNMSCLRFLNYNLKHPEHLVHWLASQKPLEVIQGNEVTSQKKYFLALAWISLQNNMPSLTKSHNKHTVPKRQTAEERAKEGGLDQRQRGRSNSFVFFARDERNHR